MSKQMNYFWQGCPLWLEQAPEGKPWQLCLRNIGWREVTYVALSADGITYEYTQSIVPGAAVQWQVCDKTPVEYLPTCVRFADGVEWINDQKGTAVDAPAKPDPAQEHYTDFAAAWSDTTPLYQPERTEQYWRCGCGQINDLARTFCGKCGKELTWVMEHLDGETTATTLIKEAEQRKAAQEQQQKALAARKAKRKKILRWTGVGVGGLAFVLAVVLLINFLFIPARHYARATAYMELDRFYEAYTEYEKAGNYQDSAEQLVNISRRLSSETSISAGYRHVVKNNRQGKAEGVGYALDTQLMVDKWNAIRAVSCGKDHTLGLHYSGTVIAVGNKKTGALDVKNWVNIVAIGAGDGFSVGLQKDGKVQAVGNNDQGQCNIKDWTDISAIAVGEDFVLGLKADGTVVAKGNNDAGQCNVFDWKDIVFIAAGNSHALGLKADGTVVSTGSNKHKECDTSEWTDIMALAAGDGFTLGLKTDGTVVATGKNDRGQTEVEDLHDIIGITCGWDYSIVIESSGSPVYLGTDADGESKITSWIIGI